MEPASLSQSTGPAAHRPGPRSILSAIAALLAGLALRAWMLARFFEVSGDSMIYGGLAKNILLHGRYAITDGSGMLHSTLIRLPGYPLFLAACFRIFGMENYWAASCVQIALALAGCCMLALFAWRITPSAYKLPAANATLWLAALCPFTAVYDAEPLTESLSLFCIALALWAVARFQDRPRWPSALAFTIAVSYAALLRPDGALLGVAFAFPIVFVLAGHHRARRLILLSLPPSRMALVCVLLSLSPFALWTLRNARVFHVFQPLAPRYATDPGEETWPGWQRWVKTWALDFTSTYQVYWNVPGAQFVVADLPDRAFDSPAQRAETEKLAADYEANGEDLSPELDARFAQLAAQRIAAHPLRYYAILPLGRLLDMAFRPRVENLPIDLDWWVYAHHWAETRFSWFYVVLNALYFLLGIAGLCLRPRLWPWMLAFLLLRSALLCTIEAPEARYTLEFFPILWVLGGAALSRLFPKRPQLR